MSKRRWRRYPWLFERWPLVWGIKDLQYSLGHYAGMIVAALSKRLVDAYRWNREIFHYAYGVPWRWLTERLWRTPMFDQRPWHCLVCGGEWLPQGGDLSVFVRYGHFEGGTFWPYDEATQVYGQTRACRAPVRGWWTPFFGGLWWPNPGQASDCVRYVHKWHFIKVDDTTPGLKFPGEGRDVLTGQLYKRRPVHPWHERVEYAMRWTWAHVRGIAVFALLRFSITWARFWAKQPFPGLARAGFWLDAPTRRIVKNGPPWGWSPGRHVPRVYPGAPGAFWWTARAWAIRARNRLLGLRHRAATFWQRRHAIWAAMPWPWYPVDGDPDGERRRIGEHLYYCWQGTGWRTPDETYFTGDGIDMHPCFAIETAEGARPTYPGLDMVIDAGRVDPDAGIPCPPCPSIETITITLGGVEIKAERLEGGHLRIVGTEGDT